METRTQEIKIGGSWSITSVAEHLSLLRDQVKAWREEEGPSGSPQALVDLQELQEIDLSGWQLLALWVRHIRRLGVEPVLVNLRDDLRHQMEGLGFGELLLAQDGRR